MSVRGATANFPPKGGLAEKIVRNTRDLLFGDREAAIRGLNSRLLPLYYPLVLGPRVRRMSLSNPLFIDGGANLGQGFRVFQRIFDPAVFRYHFFEPNPHCRAGLEAEIARARFGAPTRILDQAVWVRDETLEFHGVDPAIDPVTTGGSLIAPSSSTGARAGAADTLKVQAIDFLAYLMAVQVHHDYIAIKLDIEGAELAVLERLWDHADQLTRPIELFVEFHSIYQPPARRRADKAREMALKARVPPGVTLHTWY